MLRPALREGAGGGVRGDDGSAGGGDDVPEGFVGDVGDVDDHAEAVHLGDDLFAEGGEAVVVGDGGVVDVAGGVGPVVGVGPGEGHVTDAEAVVVAEEAEGVLDGVAAFDAHEDGEFSLLVRCDDLIGGGAELEFVGCAADLLEGGVDEFEGAAGGGVGGVLAGVDPDGEELRVEIALLCGVVVEHAAVEWVGEVPVLVDEALRGVGVGVDDDSARVHLGGVGHLLSCGGFALGVKGRGEEERGGNSKRWPSFEGGNGCSAHEKYCDCSKFISGNLMAAEVHLLWER